MVDLKKRLKDGRLSVGSWITLANTGIAEIMSGAGFDWLTIDLEHSAISLSECQLLIQVIELSGVVPLVRVGENNPYLIKRVMDAGSHGVIVPMVNSGDDAKRAVKAVKYPPIGTRGVGLARAQGHGLKFTEYKKWVNEKSIVIVQIEHYKAIANLKEILSVGGVDASMIGPYDLSASLGFPGDFSRKEVKDAIKEYKKICREMHKPAGIHVIPPYNKELGGRIEEDFRFIAFSFDALFLGQKIKDELAKIKKGNK